MVSRDLSSAPLAATLAELDERYITEKPDETWECYYAKGLIERFGNTDA